MKVSEIFQQYKFKLYTSVLCGLFVYLLISVFYQYGLAGVSLVIVGFIFGVVFLVWIMMLVFREIERKIN